MDVFYFPAGNSCLVLFLKHKTPSNLLHEHKPTLQTLKPIFRNYTSVTATSLYHKACPCIYPCNIKRQIYKETFSQTVISLLFSGGLISLLFLTCHSALCKNKKKINKKILKEKENESEREMSNILDMGGITETVESISDLGGDVR